MKITNKILFALLLLAFAAHSQSQQIRVAVMATVDDADSIQYMELNFLTGKLREIAGNTLPERQYGIMTQESIVDRLGSQERAEKECREASCLAELGRKISADYIAQGRIGRFGGMLALKVELYNSKSGNLVSTFNETSKDLFALVALLDNKAPDLFRKILRENKAASQPSVAGGISGLKTADDYEIDGSRYFLANINTEPQGATLSFDGVPNEKCPKTPCKVELAEGKIRIIAVLEQYERADTTVSIKQNNQNVSIRLKPNFGVLEIKPAYSEGIGKNENWSLTIDGKAVSSLESRLSPGKYSVKLNHRCYEDISFDVGINKDKREVFDMSSHAKPKKGGLALSAEKVGSPVSELVFVNGVRVGETPFSGSVAVCSEIEIGAGKEKVNVKLEHKQTVKHVHKVQEGKILTDKRDGKKYKIVKIGNQTWMAENLNYNASGSKCYENKSENCEKYGRLYDWATAKNACPSGWHLPSKVEYETLDKHVGGQNVAGKKLKAKNGWNNNGTDDYGFSALPGGNGNSSGVFYHVGNNGNWWSATENDAIDAYNRDMNYNYDNVGSSDDGKSGLYSVRCLQD